MKEALSHLCVDAPECLEAEDAEQVRGVMDSGLNLDLILLDLFMPGSNGFELLSELCSDPRGVPVIVLSASESVEHMRKAFDCGASGYVCKSTPHSVMLQALRLVLAGGVYAPTALLDTTIAKQNAGPTLEEPNSEGLEVKVSQAALALQNPIDQLTPRQREVLTRICEGRSNKMIARELGLSEFTVKAHVVAILRVLGVSNRIEAATMARNLGFKT